MAAGGWTSAARAAAARGLGHDKLNRLVDRVGMVGRSDRYAALAALAARCPPGYLADFAGSEARVFSQNGEDGVLAEIFAHIGVGDRRFVEFGIQDGAEGNAVLLADLGGWSGLFIEPDPGAFGRLEAKYRENPRVRTRADVVRPDTLDGILSEEGLLPHLDLLSIDVDGADYWIWRGTRSAARVVVIEYNAALGLEPLVEPYRPDRRWDGTDAFGASLAALAALGRAKGYVLVYCELAGVNAFFVREDVAEKAGLVDRAAQDVFRPPNFGLEGRRHPDGPRVDWVRVGRDGEPEAGDG